MWPSCQGDNLPVLDGPKSSMGKSNNGNGQIKQGQFKPNNSFEPIEENNTGKLKITGTKKKKKVFKHVYRFATTLKDVDKKTILKNILYLKWFFFVSSLKNKLLKSTRARAIFQLLTIKQMFL